MVKDLRSISNGKLTFYIVGSTLFVSLGTFLAGKSMNGKRVTPTIEDNIAN